MNTTLLAKRSRFACALSSNFAVLKTTDALLHFDEFEFEQFIDELGKQKIYLSHIQQAEWEKDFSDCKHDCNALTNQIKATDNEIDRTVFSLFELTEEEIRVVRSRNVR